MTERPPADPHEVMRLLREEIGNLVKTVPGPVASVSLRLGECALDVSWAHPAGVPAPGAPAAAPSGEAEAAPGRVPEPEAAEDPSLHAVTAPLVGTFYVAPEPGAAPFVQVGDQVSAGQTIGIVEAMKLMNPVTTEVAGEIVEMVAGNADPVEYDQVLVRIRAAAQ
jgi:acetyl-CoA carboxylase biotin carboxyl carrier protein